MRSGTPIQVYLPPGMKELLVEVARRNMRKISAEVVMAIQNHLAANGSPYTPDTTPPEPPAAKKGKRK